MGISGSFRGARGCERGTMLGPNHLLDTLYWAGRCMSKGLQTRRCVRSTPPRIGRDAIGARGATNEEVCEVHTTSYWAGCCRSEGATNEEACEVHATSYWARAIANVRR